jgi:hypothetical protein
MNIAGQSANPAFPKTRPYQDAGHNQQNACDDQKFPDFVH